MTNKSGRCCSAAYGLDRSARDKGNTMNVSESMLTYRKKERGSTIAASAWSWTTTKAEPTALGDKQMPDRQNGVLQP
ncbi:hypothetical protein [Bacillus sp. FJAT-52991]|uniref:Uncharacterized protein n=1 Tax=Bacillus kandeliae TaxID=3129297 RepID=A0ABZ2N6W8_9BACI